MRNDQDPQGQTLTVAAVSQPSTDGTLTGNLATGFTYTPSSEPRFVNTDHDLAYLVVDPDGHVARELIRIRILAADDTNRAPVAANDVALTNAATTVQVITSGNDFDPDGDSFSVVAVDRPANGRIDGFGGNFFNYTPNPGFAGIDTITYRLRDSHGLLATGTVNGLGRHRRLDRPEPATRRRLLHRLPRLHRVLRRPPTCCATTKTPRARR